MAGTWRGLEPVASSPQEMAAFVKEETARWRQLSGLVEKLLGEEA